MKQINYFLLIILLFFSSLVSAESWYQVEVIVFDRLYPNLGGEQWQDESFSIRDDVVELQTADSIDSGQGLIPYKVLNKSRNRLGGIYNVFKLSSEYRPLIHLSWQQPATDRRRSRHVHLQRLDGNAAATAPVAMATEEPEFIEELFVPDRIIDGSIRIRSGFYLHADIDMSYFKQLPAENKIIRSSEQSFIDPAEKTVIKLTETRKIKLNEIHYFDHPMYGVILQVSRL